MSSEEKGKRKQDRKNATKGKKKLKTDSALVLPHHPAAVSDFIPNPATEKPEPMLVEKNYVMNEEGKWIEEPSSINELAHSFNEAISDPLVDLLSCPFHCKPLTRKKPPAEVEKKEVLFCPVINCPVFLFADNMEPYVRALHYTLPSKDVEECWDILACYCNQTPSLKLSTSQLNPNRLYLVCANFNKDLKCPYFQWFDGPFEPKNQAWQDEIRFVLSHQPVPSTRQQAVAQEKQRKEKEKQGNLLVYFGDIQTNLKAKKEIADCPFGGGGDGGRGGGSSERVSSNSEGESLDEKTPQPKRDPFIYMVPF